MSTCELCRSRRIEFFHKMNNFYYFSCHRCYTLFLQPKPTEKEIISYYKKTFQYSAGGINEKQIRQRAQIILKNLKKLNPVGKHLLDIGSGYGYFLGESVKAGLITEGVEPSKDLYFTSANRLIETKIYNLDFSKYFNKFKAKKFDFITMIHTIEHVLNPKEIINRALKLLRPGGILYLETPNLDSHLFRAEKYSYTFLTPPDHIWIFSKKSFEYILRVEKNVSIEKVSSYSYPEHFMGILKKKLEILNPNHEKNSKTESSKFKITHAFGNSNSAIVSEFDIRASNLKYFLFDKFIAPLFTPLLNLGIYGSILELYVKKK